jgi:hypothetical protein
MLRDTAFCCAQRCHIAWKGLRATTGDHPRPKQIGEEDFAAILAAVARKPGGAGREDIAKAPPNNLPPRTPHFRLRNLVQAGRLTTQGEGRAVRYLLLAAPMAPGATSPEPAEAAPVVPVSPAGAAIQRNLRRPLEARKPVSYNR